MTSQLYTSPDFLLHQDRHHQDHQYDNLPDQCHRHCTSDINLWCIHTCLVPRGCLSLIPDIRCSGSSNRITPDALHCSLLHSTETSNNQNCMTCAVLCCQFQHCTISVLINTEVIICRWLYLLIVSQNNIFSCRGK